VEGTRHVGASTSIDKAMPKVLTLAPTARAREVWTKKRPHRGIRRQNRGQKPKRHLPSPRRARTEQGPQVSERPYLAGGAHGCDRPAHRGRCACRALPTVESQEGKLGPPTDELGERKYGFCFRCLSELGKPCQQ
jgi:hypothetical protein